VVNYSKHCVSIVYYMVSKLQDSCRFSFFSLFFSQPHFIKQMSSSSRQSALTPNPEPHSTPLTAVHNLITIKLTHENYLLWKAQVVPYLHGQHLFNFVDLNALATWPFFMCNSIPSPRKNLHFFFFFLMENLHLC
jgi:hypothetical protein